MQASTIKTLIRAGFLSASCLIATSAAEARGRHHSAGHSSGHASYSAHGAHRGRHYAMRGAAVIQCVAFAKSNSDVALSGNAANWWQNAEGVYARGSAPEAGSVLNFRATSRMRLGHVAVVTNVIDGRTIQIDQSHWNARGVSRDVSVVDVSENNDWTAVRVGLGHQGTYGSIYPTYGFIYARPDTGRLVTARNGVIVPRMGARAMEVAEMPVAAHGVMSQGTDLSGAVLSDDAPNRALR